VRAIKTKASLGMPRRRLGIRMRARRCLFIFLLVIASASVPLQSQDIRGLLHERYWGHAVKLLVDIPYGNRAVIFSSGRSLVAPVDISARSNGRFCSTKRGYVISAVDVHPGEVEFIISEHTILPNPPWSPGPDDACRSCGRLSANPVTPVAAFIFQYSSPDGLTAKVITESVRSFMKVFNQRISFSLRRP
jgi:hypothetical protein